jgi:hypothetical protein
VAAPYSADAYMASAAVAAPPVADVLGLAATSMAATTVGAAPSENGNYVTNTFLFCLCDRVNTAHRDLVTGNRQFAGISTVVYWWY